MADNLVENNLRSPQSMTVVVPPGHVAAAISPARKSKINWTAIIGGGLIAINQGLAMIGHSPVSVDPAVVGQISATLGVLTSLVVIVQRTWLTAK